MLTDLLALLGGLALLMGGATALVRGASALALRFGLTPLVVGLTVVAFGTSAPELVVSVDAALSGAGGIAVGNVVGSNVANVGLILALAALVRPITVDRTLVRRDFPVLLGVTAVAAALLWDRQVGPVEGGALVVGLVLYVGWSLRQARRDHAAAVDLPATPSGPAWRDGLLVGAGLAGLILGAEWFVGGAVAIAEAAGVSSAVIGLTVVAVGTSLPELATSVVAAFRGESEIAAGNVVGSNLFNLLGILGVAALVRPLAAPGLSPVDPAVMGAFAVGAAVLCWTGGRLTRPEGAVLLVGYGGYVAYLVGLHA